MVKQGGKLIVIEGTDGSGKATQANLLLKRLGERGLKPKKLSLPQYGKKSAGPTEEYLSGKYGQSYKVDPYAASVLFAVDHFDLAQEIKRLLREGYVVVMDRYVDSNAGHQGGKIKDRLKRAKFVRWLYELEYNILKIPKPDIVLILYMPAAVSQELALKRQSQLGKAADLHEANLDHLQGAEEAYLWLAENYPQEHKLIECIESGQILTPDKIHELVWKQLFHTI